MEIFLEAVGYTGPTAAEWNRRRVGGVPWCKERRSTRWGRVVQEKLLPDKKSIGLNGATSLDASSWCLQSVPKVQAHHFGMYHVTEGEAHKGDVETYLWGLSHEKRFSLADTEAKQCSGRNDQRDANDGSRHLESKTLWWQSEDLNVNGPLRALSHRV